MKSSKDICGKIFLERDISGKKIKNRQNRVANRYEQKTIVPNTHKEKNQSREIPRLERTNGRRREEP